MLYTNVDHLKNYEKACEKLAEAFLSELYPEDFPDDAYWVGGEIGDVLMWGDWFVTMGNISDYFRHGYKPDDFFNWYDDCIGSGDENLKVNMKNYLKLKNNEKAN